MEQNGKVYDLHKQTWAVHHLPAGVDYADKIFFDQFKEKFGYDAEVVIREHYDKVIHIWVGPVETEGPMATLLEELDAD